MTEARALVSVVVPFYNEVDGVERFYESLCCALGQLADVDFEIICVDDGSRDGTLQRLIALVDRDPRVRAVELSRNFGKEAALSAGIDLATGDAVIPIDADLQDPPELIPVLIGEWRKGADVVLARRTQRPSDSYLKRTSARCFYHFHNILSPIKIPDNVGDFRLMNRPAVDALKRLPERNRFMKGLFAWIGFKTTTVDYFSTAPLKLWTYLGGIGAILSTIYAAIIILRTLIRGVDIPGYASLLVVVLFIGSIQLIGIGVLGEYIGRIYMESKQRPGYIVRKSYGYADRP